MLHCIAAKHTNAEVPHTHCWLMFVGLLNSRPHESGNFDLHILSKVWKNLGIPKDVFNPYTHSLLLFLKKIKSIVLLSFLGKIKDCFELHRTEHAVRFAKNFTFIVFNLLHMLGWAVLSRRYKLFSEPALAALYVIVLVRPYVCWSVHQHLVLISQNI